MAVVDAVVEGATTTDPRQARITIRDTTPDTIRGKMPGTVWGLLLQRTMATDHLLRDTMAGRPLHSSRGRRQRLHRREMRTTGMRCGDCLVRWTRTVCGSVYAEYLDISS